MNRTIKLACSLVLVSLASLYGRGVHLDPVLQKQPTQGPSGPIKVKSAPTTVKPSATSGQTTPTGTSQIAATTSRNSQTQQILSSSKNSPQNKCSEFFLIYIVTLSDIAIFSSLHYLIIDGL